jgi:hypothetical protein
MSIAKYQCFGGQVLNNPERGSKVLQNAGNYLPINTALYHRRLDSSCWYRYVDGMFAIWSGEWRNYGFSSI